MAEPNHRGQCTIELALVTLTLTAVLVILSQSGHAISRGFARAQLSGGRR